MAVPKKYKDIKDKEPVVHLLHELDMSSTYSYSSYLRWQFDERVELIKGKVLEMSAPSVLHQRVLLRIAVKFDTASKIESCETFVAPFDVRLPGRSKANSAIFTVVQPDICVVCDAGKLDVKGCLGAPDLVVEILSPGNHQKELLIKYDLYQEFGVKEYLIVEPEKKLLLQYVLNSEGKFAEKQVFSGADVYHSSVLPDISLCPDQVFGY